MAAEEVADEGSIVLSFTDNGYVRYNRLNFGTREPLAFRINVKSSNGGRVTVYEGGHNGSVLGSCEFPKSDSYVTVCGDILTAVNGIPDITLEFQSNGDGETLLRDWQFMLPSWASYTDPLKITYAANYPYRSGGIVRRPSTDGGSLAGLQVEGITNGSYVLYDFVRFRENSVTIPFHIRAMPIAEGTIEILAGEFDIDYHWLGELKIEGRTGVWADFSCDLEFTEWFPMWNGDNTRQDLKLLFKGEDGKELFAISEFYMGHEKPGPAGVRDSIVRTGDARYINANSIAIEGNEFMEFDESEIIETGVIYSWAFDFHLHLDDPDVTVFETASDAGSPYTVTINELMPMPYPGISFYCYRAYVKTATEMYYGNAKRIEVK
jgi:hypothetical protein